MIDIKLCCVILRFLRPCVTMDECYLASFHVSLLDPEDENVGQGVESMKATEITIHGPLVSTC